MSKTMRFQAFSLFFFLAAMGQAKAQDESVTLSISDALRILRDQNPQISGARANAHKESSLVKSQYALPDPMVSYQELDRGSTTKYWGVSQKIDFPTTYIHRGSAQSHRAEAADAQQKLIALQMRGDVISTYYELYSLRRMIEFTDANRNAIREVARVAERKYASGDVSQSDSMRAHVEQTSLEAEIRILRQKETIALSRLKELLNIPQTQNVSLLEANLSVPSLPNFESSLEESLDLKIADEQLKEAGSKKAEAISEFLPDFQVRYQRRFSGMPENSDILMLEASVPLWFWGQTGKTQAATYEQERKRSELLATRNRIDREQNALVENLKTQKELLDIYQNALIPQAQTSYSTTSSAYRASKASFLDLLERERFLLGVQIKSYATLIDYIRLLTRYEQVVGKELIDLSNPEENL